MYNIHLDIMSLTPYNKTEVINFLFQKYKLDVHITILQHLKKKKTILQYCEE